MVKPTDLSGANNPRSELWDRLERLTRASHVLAGDPAARAAIDAEVVAVQAQLCDLLNQRVTARPPRPAA